MSKFFQFLKSGSSRAALVLAAGAALAFSTATAWADADHVALVIGNQSYKYVPALVNPVEDAKAIAQKLKELNFDVVEDYDVDANSLRGKVGEFEDKVQTAKVALVYYAGHGFTFKSENYLLPVDFQMKRGQDPGLHSLTVSSILNQLGSDRRVTIVILDACRDNALDIDGNRGTARGLGPVNDADSLGALVVYSTALFKTALDGAPGQHSPFAQALLDHLKDPDVPVEDMMTRVRREVYANTKQQQMPWASSALLGEAVVLNPSPAAATPAPLPVAPAAQAVAPVPVVTPTPQVVASVPVVVPPPSAVVPPPLANLPPAPVQVVAQPQRAEAPVAQPAAFAPAGGNVTAAVDPSATPDTSANWRAEIGTVDTETKLNLTAASVKKIQVHLQIRRFFHGAVNGNLDDGRTRDAIMEWQKTEYLKPTGRIGQGQLDALLAISPEPPKPTDLKRDVGTFDTQNALGLSFDEIREIQLRLAANGFLKAAPSGKFDAATTDAITRFQREEGVPTTGSLGPVQLQQLFARTESLYEDQLSGDTASSGPTTREPTASGHAAPSYHHNSVQHHYYSNGGGNPFAQFFNGIGQGIGNGLSNRMR